MTLAAVLARLVLRRVTPGDHPRGGKVHLRIWLADRIQDELAAAGLGGAPWFPYYSRLLGAKVGHGVDLHTLPPVTGFLTVGKDAAIEPEVDLAGYWIDGDVVRVGRDPDRRARPDRRPQHARARCRRRQGVRDRAGLAGPRRGPERGVLVGLSRGAPGQGARPLVEAGATEGGPLARHVRRRRAADRQPARGCDSLRVARSCGPSYTTPTRLPTLVRTRAAVAAAGRASSGTSSCSG